MAREVLDIFRDKVVVDPNTECWLWTKSTRNGYGQLMVNKYPWYAHRYAYTACKGQIPEGVLVRHECNNTLCCNPDHLILGDDLDNWRDSINAHHSARFKKATIWVINGERYVGIRAASIGTGLPVATISKYSDNGIFNLEAYREGCLKNRTEPKI